MLVGIPKGDSDPLLFDQSIEYRYLDLQLIAQLKQILFIQFHGISICSDIEEFVLQKIVRICHKL